MMNISKIQISGWQNAIKGLRYSFNSEDKSDSSYSIVHNEDGPQIFVFLGKEDLKLILNLIKGGSPHRKFLRAVHIQMSIKASMTWWKQYDTYKVSTTTLSRSTMHTVMKGLLTLDDFDPNINTPVLNDIIIYINELIFKYNEIKGLPETKAEDLKNLFFQVIDILPMCYMQERMIDINYETLLNIISQRRNHKLQNEWGYFCDELLETIPYLKEFYNATEGVVNED